VTVSDDSGCSGSSSINVLNGASQTLEIMGDTMICPGAFTSLTVDSNFVSYAWSNGLNTPSVIVSDPDTYIVTATSANGCESVDSVMVQELNAPDLSILGPDKYCPGESITLMANDVYDTYLWSTGETTASIEVDSEMTVELEVTDSEGCTANSSVSIQAFDPATPTIGGSYAFCAGSFTTLDGGSEYVSWSWSTGETDQIIQVDQEITIELTVIDTNGCQGVVTAMITEENTLTPTIIGDDMICAGATGILDGGSGFGSWTWSTGETTQTIMVTEADTYLLTVTDISGNCDGTGSIEVVVNDLPAPEILGTPFFCPDGTTTVSLSQSYDTHLWSNGEEGTSISVDSAGIYFVTVTDNNGCQGSSMVDVTQIDLPIIDLNSVDCSADMLTYQVDVVTDADILETIPPDQTVSTTSSGFLIMDIDVSTDITLILENSNTGCEDQRLVNAPNCNCSAIADAGADQDIFCDQLEVTLGGTGTTTGADFSIEWQDEDGNAISTDEQITVNAEGTYTIFVTDEILQCTEEDQVIVTAFSDPEPIINGEAVICPNSSTLLSLDSSYPEIEWSTGETTQEISVSLQDDYTVTVTDANGCQTSTNFVVDIFSFPSVDFAPECLTGQSVYQYELITQANELTVDVGDVTTTPMGFLISNIPENISVNASLTYDPIDCVESLFLQAPNCDCTAISDAGPDQSLDCNVQTVTLGGADTSTGSDYNYEWTDQGVVVGTDATYTTSTAGVYVLTVTDLLLDCDVIDIVNVDLIPLAEPEIEGADKLCELQTTTLSLTETYAEYAWSTLEDTDQIVVSDAGFYDVTITDDNNCTAVAEWTITSNPSPQLDFTLECSDDNLLYDIDIITDGNSGTSGCGFDCNFSGWMYARL